MASSEEGEEAATPSDASSTKSKYPTTSQVRELIRLKSSDPAWRVLRVSRQEGKVHCDCCNKDIRGWENDVISHLKSSGHKERTSSGSASIHMFLASGKKRTHAEIEATADEEFLARLYVHVEGCGISYSTFHALMTPSFQAVLRERQLHLPSPAHMRRAHFDRALKMVQQSVDELIANDPFTLLVDESPRHDRTSVVLIAAANWRSFSLLQAMILRPDQAVDGQLVVDLIKQVLQTRNLNQEDFIAYGADNCSYAKKAYRLLLKDFPRIKHVGCLSHVIHLLSKSMLQEGKKKTPHFPCTIELLNLLNGVFASRASVVERGRQERFLLKFERAPRSLFWLVPGRWACKLNSLLWIAQNRKEFLEFVREEKGLCSHDHWQRITELLTSVSARMELAISAKIADPIRALLLVSESKQVSVTFEAYTSLNQLINGLRSFLQSPADCKVVVQSIASKELVVMSEDVLSGHAQHLVASLRCVVDKFDKHLSYLHDVFPFFEHLKPEAMFASSEQPPLPPGLLFYTDNEILVHGEWQRLTAADSIDRLHWRSQATKDRPSMEDFWYSYKDKYPNLNAIVRRLLGLRTGIVDVERLFKTLRAIEVPQRLHMNNNTLEGLLQIRCNAIHADTWSRGSGVTDVDE
jgi:hypothetical protein